MSHTQKHFLKHHFMYGRDKTTKTPSGCSSQHHWKDHFLHRILKDS